MITLVTLTEFLYRAQPRGPVGFCDLTIARCGPVVFVLWRERDDNPGPSVTHAAEALAYKVWDEVLLCCDPYTITFFETYDGIAFDVVTFVALPQLVRDDIGGTIGVIGGFDVPGWRRVQAGELALFRS